MMQSKITHWDRYVKTKGNKRIEMCEKKIVKKTIRFWNNRRLIEWETFIYPVGIKSTQCVNESNFNSSNHAISNFVAFGLSVINGGTIVAKLEKCDSFTLWIILLCITKQPPPTHSLRRKTTFRNASSRILFTTVYELSIYKTICASSLRGWHLGC